MSDGTTKTKKTAHFLKYPVMLVHGFGFRDGKRINYWGRIPKLLEEKGCAVFYGKQDSSGTIEDNALFLKERIEEILRETDAKKVNLIAHSKGGLEARYLFVASSSDHSLIGRRKRRARYAEIRRLGRF